MAAPWLKYAPAQDAGPWSKYKPDPQAADIASQAAALSPDDRSFQMHKAGPLGDFLRQQAMQPKDGETPDQTDQRLYGAPMQGPSKLMSGAAGFADAATMGFGDEGDAALASLANGRSYTDNLNDFRQMQGVLKQDNPWSYFGGQAVGAVAPAIGSGGVGGGSLGGQMLRGAGAGAAQGAVYGYGSGEGGAENRLQNAGLNAAGGAIFGGTAPVVGKAAGSAVNAAVNGWKGLSDWLAGSGVDSGATNAILEQLQNAGHTPQSAAAALDKLGPEGMMADIVPKYTAQTAGATNEAGSTIADALASRRLGVDQRIQPELDAAFGQFQDPYTFAQGIKADKAAINPQYTQAIQSNQTLMPHSLAEIDPALADVSNMSAGNRGLMSSHIANINDALSATDPQQQASRLLDLRKNLDAQIVYDPRQMAMLSPADRASQGVTKQARAIVDDILKNNVSGIAQADASHAPLSMQQKAFDYGRKEMLAGGQNSITPAENAARLMQMTDPERLATANGVRANLQQQLFNTSRNPETAGDAIFNRDFNNQKVADLVGQQNADNLGQSMLREKTFMDTSKLAEPGFGSRTNTTVSNGNPWNPQEKPDSLAKEMAMGAFYGKEFGPQGMVVGGATPAIKRIYSVLTDRGGVDPQLAGQVAKNLVAQGTSRKTLIDALTKSAQNSASSLARSQAAQKLVTALTAPFAITTGRDAADYGRGVLARAGLMPIPQQ